MPLVRHFLLDFDFAVLSHPLSSSLPTTTMAARSESRMSFDSNPSRRSSPESLAAYWDPPAPAAGAARKRKVSAPSPSSTSNPDAPPALLLRR
jgi:hypothetical protein